MLASPASRGVNLSYPPIHKENESVERPFPAYKGDDPYIFVSYAHEDAALVYPELTRLRDQGFNIWYDEGISPGSTWRDEVALALTQCSVFLFFVSPRSVVSSNCMNEVNFSLSRERRLLAVHLTRTELPVGLELSLSAMQAIVREDHSVEAYGEKLAGSLTSLLPASRAAAIPSHDSNSKSKVEEKSIAILPLVNRSNDADNQYMCDGISEELISGLSRVDGLEVASQLASFRFRDKDLDPAVMGEQLNVAHILSGSVQKSGNRVRISVLLSKAADGKALWSERYDRELEDIFELQEEVARQVIDALKVELGAGGKSQVVEVGTKDLRAYDLFLLGVHEVRKQTRYSLEQGLHHLEQATQLDNTFGRAYWWMYICQFRLMGVGFPRDEMTSLAEESLRNAEAAGFTPPIPWFQAHRDLHPEMQPGQKELATEACEKIRAADVQWDSFEYLQLSRCLIAAGHFHSALEFVERYLDLATHDLGDTNIPQWYRHLLLRLGRFERGIELLSQHIASRPDDAIAVAERALLYSRTGQYEKAEEDLAEVAKAFPRGRSFAQFYHLYWRRDLDAAKECFTWLESRRSLQPIFKYWGCFLLGDIDGGIKYVEEAISRGVSTLQPVDAAFVSLQGTWCLPPSVALRVERHPGFQAIMQRFGVDDAWRDELIGMANELTDITGIIVRRDQDY